MTARAVTEWIGSSPEAKIPSRVQERVWLRCGGRCQLECGRKLFPGDKWEIDHKHALINGGEHRESNLRLVCVPCHRIKSDEDVAEKALVSKKRQKHIGIKRTSRPMPGSKASGLRRRMDGTVERRFT